MPSIIIPRRGITKEQALDVCMRAFSGKYEVYASQLLMVDFVIKKSDWTGISVRVRDHDQGTKIVFYPFAPAFWVRFLMMGLITLIILYFGPWSQMKTEIQAFFASSPELHALPAGQPAPHALPGR